MNKNIVILFSVILFSACNDSGNGPVKQAEASNVASIDSSGVSPAKVDMAQNDANFLVFAADVGAFEVKAGNLASTKSHNLKVKAFAIMMVQDHSSMNKDVASVAAKKNVTLATDLSTSMKEEWAKLDSLKGQKFDDEYANFNVKGHKEVISRFEAVTNSTDSYSPEVMQLAATALPTLKEHLQHATTLQADFTAEK